MKKNILFIMSDDHAANAISLYGSRLAEVMKTPYIDSIGKEGAWLENCYCTNAVCTPSRATILTGQHSHVNGVRTLFDSLDDEAVTFPGLLRENGYQTAVIGKWHLHGRPQNFDHFDVLGYPWQQGLYFDPEFLDETSDWEFALGPDVNFRTYHGKKEKGYVTDIITDKCIEWLKVRDPQKPFLLLCHHKAPHDEFEYRYWLHMTHCDTPAHYGIRTRDYKLVFYYGLALDANGALPDSTPCGWELYDLQKDPYEMRNVYHDPAYGTVVCELKNRLKRMKEECMDPDDKYPEVKALSGL